VYSSSPYSNDEIVYKPFEDQERNNNQIKQGVLGIWQHALPSLNRFLASVKDTEYREMHAPENEVRRRDQQLP
jgi:hypothetical protein